MALTVVNLVTGAVFLALRSLMVTRWAGPSLERSRNVSIERIHIGWRDGGVPPYRKRIGCGTCGGRRDRPRRLTPVAGVSRSGATIRRSAPTISRETRHSLLLRLGRNRVSSQLNAAIIRPAALATVITSNAASDFVSRRRALSDSRMESSTRMRACAWSTCVSARTRPVWAST